MISPIGPEARIIQTRNDPWSSTRGVPVLPSAVSASSFPLVVPTLTPLGLLAGAEAGGDPRSWAIAGEPGPTNRPTPMTDEYHDINNPATTFLQHVTRASSPRSAYRIGAAQTTETVASS